MKIKTYGRMELAQLYNSRANAQNAWLCLRRWINGCQELHEKLQASGYDGKSRTFTPEQVRLIVYYLGEP